MYYKEFLLDFLTEYQKDFERFMSEEYLDINLNPRFSPEMIERIYDKIIKEIKEA